MVSNTSILFMILSGIIALLLPIILTIYACKKHKASIKAVLVGALTFFIFQVVTRFPLLTFLGKQNWYQVMTTNIFLIALFLGLTAGIFEEIGRFISFKFLLKDKLNWENALAFGIGHGGIEAIILLGIASINNVVYSLLINSGAFDSTISANLPIEVANNIKEQLINTSPILFLAGGIERVFAITIHIALSIIVLYGVKLKQFKYVIYAILLHTLVNTPSAILSLKKVNFWVIESFIGILAVIGFIFIIKSKEIFKAKFDEEEIDMKL